MRKFLFSLALFLQAQLFFAQVEFVGNPKYGRLRNFVYDKTVQNKVYSTTAIDKHIMVSQDNGKNWNVLFTLPYPATIKEMRLTNNGKALSFITDSREDDKLMVLDLQSLNITRQFTTPDPSTNLEKYALYDNDLMDTAVIIMGKDGHDQALYTSDGGNTWTKIYDGLDHERVQLSDITMDPSNPQTLYMARNGGPGNVDGGLLKSTNTGATWVESLNGIILQNIAIDPQNPQVLYVGSGLLWSHPEQHQAVYKTVNGGNSWSEQVGITWPSSISGMSNVSGLKINPYNSSHVLMMSGDRVAVTTNAGNTWTTTIHNGVSDENSYFYGTGAAFNPYQPGDVFIDNGYYPKFSTNGGTTLTTIANPYFRGEGKINLIKDNNVNHLLYGVQHGYTLKNLSTNQETSIDVYPLTEFPLGENIRHIFIDKNKPGRVYSKHGGQTMGTITVSDDYGATQAPIYTPVDFPDPFFTAAQTHPFKSNMVWIATAFGDAALAGEVKARLIKVNFTDITNPQNQAITLPSNAGFISGIQFNENNSGEVLITLGNKVYRTLNEGNSWTEITIGLEDLNFSDLIFNLAQNPLDNNQYTMATTNGIYTSTNRGKTWTKIYNESVQKIEHSDKKNGQIIAFSDANWNYLTKNRVLYTNDGGNSWQEKTTADAYYNSAILDGTAHFVNSTTVEVFLTTNSLGILKDIITFPAADHTKSIKDETSGKDTKEIEISLYPNPAHDVLNIQLDDTITEFMVIIYNGSGKAVMEVKNQKTINISSLENGMYHVKVAPKQGKTIVKNLIKK